MRLFCCASRAGLWFVVGASALSSCGDVFTNVPESAAYNLVYSLSIPNAATFNTASIPYTTDNSSAIGRGSFDRVAYYMELQPIAGGPAQWVYASMNAFTDSAQRIGVPNRSGSFFQQPVSSVNVATNVAGITTGTGLSGYNIEFWRTNYAAGNSASVANASTSTFDWGDVPSNGGYGSMQIHHNSGSKPLFSYSRWGGGSVGNSDIGLGTSSTGNPDYTFRANSADFSIKLLQVLARPAATPIGHKIQIMTLGDSITHGTPVAGGYRTRLQQRLTDAGFNFEFVGSQVDNASTALALSGRVTHEGHGGYRIDQIHDNLNGLATTGGTNNNGYWLNPTTDPDYILLHIGTNDFGQNYNTATAIDRFDALISRITSLRPNAHLIVTNLMERTSNTTANTLLNSQFNPYVEDVVDAHRALGERVYFLDMHAAINPLTDLADGLHPNQQGYDKMGDAFFGAIQAVPEPSGAALLAALALTLARRRGRNSA